MHKLQCSGQTKQQGPSRIPHSVPCSWSCSAKHPEAQLHYLAYVRTPVCIWRRGDFAEEIDGCLGGFCGENCGEDRRENRGELLIKCRVNCWRAFCLGINSTKTTSKIHPKFTLKFTRNPPQNSPQNSPSTYENPRKFTLQELCRDNLGAPVCEHRCPSSPSRLDHRTCVIHTTGLPHFQFTAFSSFLLEIGILSKIE